MCASRWASAYGQENNFLYFGDGFLDGHLQAMADRPGCELRRVEDGRQEECCACKTSDRVAAAPLLAGSSNISWTLSAWQIWTRNGV